MFIDRIHRRVEIQPVLFSSPTQEPDGDPGPEIPAPDRPVPGTPKPGDPPRPPRPGDPPPPRPQPDTPGPVRPGAVGNRLVAVLFVLLLAGGTVVPAMANEADADKAVPVAAPLNDNQILAAIERDLQFDDAVSQDMVNVSVDAGVVTLSGSTHTLFGKRRAQRLAASLKGVRAVVNRIRVLSDGRDDELIAADIHAGLEDDPMIDRSELVTEVEHGVVTLSGFTESYAAKQWVGKLVADVRGVTGVDNQLTIRVRELRPDGDIRPEIIRRFQLSPFLAEGLIEVEVDDGQVTLTGTVGSLAEKSVATMLSWVVGVKNVNASQIQVLPLLDQHGRRDKFTALRNDVQVRRAVQDALLYDPRVPQAEVEVRVQDGMVTLLGDVSRLTAKRAAEEDANNTLGVRGVSNLLNVKPEESQTDSQISDRAQQALDRDAQLLGQGVKAVSHGGKVLLSGSVGSFFERRRAELVVSNVPGVLEIDNQLTVATNWQPKPDDEIKNDLLRRFRWSPWLENEQVTVSVDDGIVTLRGTVDTRQERNAAERHARQAGAKRVVDRVHIRSGRMTPVGLKATVVTDQPVYSIEPRQTGPAFRDFLKAAERVRDFDSLPPPPEVDMALKLHNTSDHPIDFRLGHDSGGLEMVLVGEGAVHVQMGRPFVSDFQAGTKRTLQPSETYLIPIEALQYGFRNVTDRWYWTEPGKYTLHITLTWPRERTGLFGQFAVTAEPITLTVKKSTEKD